jgi:hypothetical protein
MRLSFHKQKEKMAQDLVHDSNKPVPMFAIQQNTAGKIQARI